MFKISIIIPLYNGVKYVRNCYKSLLNQSCNDWQVVFVNDGSTDNSESILQELAERDSRVKVISQPNAGVAVARKVGVENAEGEYVTFLDIDDTIVPNAISIFQNIFESLKADIIVTGINIIENNITKEIIQYKDSIISGTSLFHLMSVGKVRWQLWSKAYKRSLFKTIKNPNGIISGEDMAVCMQLAAIAQKVVISNKVIYNYNMEQGSVTHSSNPKLSTDPIEAAKIVESQVVSFLDSKKFLNSIDCLFLLCISSCLRTSTKDNRKLLASAFDNHCTLYSIQKLPMLKIINLLLYRYLGLNISHMKS